MSIELHTWNTPNGRKISVALEEMGLPYTVKPVNISKGEQFAPAFVKISPNSKIPTPRLLIMSFSGALPYLRLRLDLNRSVRSSGEKA